MVRAAWFILKESHPDDPVAASQIRPTVRAVTAAEPTTNEINQVAARLALVRRPSADLC